MAKKSPLQTVKDEHGDKEKLVDKLVDMVDRGEVEKDDFRGRLLAMANSKLLRLHRVHSELKERFGNKDQLIDAIAGLLNRAKDKDYVAKLQSWTPVRLLDLLQTAEKRAKKAEKAA